MAVITTLEVGAACVAHAAFLAADGTPGAISGTPVWAASSASATVNARADGLSADITRNDASPLTITVTAQNAASGGPDIVGSGDLPLPAVVAQAPATSATISFEDS